MKKKIICIIIFCLMVIPIIWSMLKKVPEGTSFEGGYHQVSSIEFLSDLTYQQGEKDLHELTILQQQLDMIEAAREFILMDMFLFNDDYDRSIIQFPRSVERVANALIDKKMANPGMDIVFITDPINGFYGAYEEANIKRMKDIGIQVVVTDLDQMKDSNPLFSGYYRSYLKWFGTKGPSWIKNPTDQGKPKVKIRNFFRLLNLKANHRKILVTDQEGLVTSANPHDPSTFHSNVAIKFKGEVINDMIEAERTIVEFSGEEMPSFKYQQTDRNFIENTKVRYLTEKAIYKRLLECIDATKKGDKIQIGIFYFSEFSVMKALKEAAERGVLIEMIADPNKNAFGLKMNGSPNCQSLSKLGDKWDNFIIKWYNIGREQYHVKMASFTYPVHNTILIGSANYTRRNLKGYNLESDLEIITVPNSKISLDIQAYFDRIWNNRDGLYTVDFNTYVDKGFFKYKLYQIQEFTGVCIY